MSVRVWIVAGVLFGVGCGGEDEASNNDVGLCYELFSGGSKLRTSCSIGDNEDSCDPGWTWYGDYDDFGDCGDAGERILSDFGRDGTKPTRGGGARGSGSGSGGGSSGGGGGGDCEASCPSEVSDVQLDTFCRTACCYSVSGAADAARSTCQAGAPLGSSRCRYCR